MLCEQRDRLAQHLKAQGVETLVHYPVPVHFQAPCKDMRRDSHGLAFAERHAAQCLSIPCHPQMSDSNVTKVIDAINAFN